MRRLALHALGACLAAGTAVAPAVAQSVPPAEIAACVCLRRAVDALGAEMTAKQQALADLRAELERATAQLEAARDRMDVNDPQAGAHFREMLAHRDALFRRASGDAVTDAGGAVERFNRSSE